MAIDDVIELDDPEQCESVGESCQSPTHAFDRNAGAIETSNICSTHVSNVSISTKLPEADQQRKLILLS
jgi:hypothetical protein